MSPNAVPSPLIGFWGPPTLFCVPSRCFQVPPFCRVPSFMSWGPPHCLVCVSHHVPGSPNAILCPLIASWCPLSCPGFPNNVLSLLSRPGVPLVSPNPILSPLLCPGVPKPDPVTPLVSLGPILSPLLRSGVPKRSRVTLIVSPNPILSPFLCPGVPKPHSVNLLVSLVPILSPFLCLGVPGPDSVTPLMSWCPQI